MAIRSSMGLYAATVRRMDSSVQTKSGSSAPFTHNTDQLALIIHLPEKFAKPVFCLREIDREKRL